MVGHYRRQFVRFLFLCLGLLNAPAAVGGPRGHSLVEGAPTKSGRDFVAGDNGSAYALNGGARATFEPGARYSFQPSMQLKLGAPNEPKTDTQVINLLSGRVEVDVDAGLATAVLVRGPRKLSSVNKGGKSVFIADPEFATVASLGGEMLYGIGNRFRVLASERSLTVGGTNTAEALPLVGQPSFTAKHALVLAVGSFGEAKLAWAPVKGADSYVLTIETVGSGKPPRKLRTRDSTAQLSGLEPGEYTVSAIAEDSKSIPGRASEQMRVHVLGVEIPAGAKVTGDGAVVLNKRQRVALVAAKGLEMTYNASTQFIPAPNAVGLSRHEPTVVRFRIPGTTDERRLRLEPVGLRARVSLGPVLASWPRDPVRISVTLYDIGGRPVPHDAFVTVEVTINLKPVSVDWQRTGSELTATLEPQEGRGPWIVRAEVLDKRRSSLGRGFLEVIRTPAGKKRAPAATNDIAGL